MRPFDNSKMRIELYTHGMLIIPNSEKQYNHLKTFFKNWAEKKKVWDRNSRRFVYEESALYYHEYQNKTFRTHRALLVPVLKYLKAEWLKSYSPLQSLKDPLISENIDLIKHELTATDNVEHVIKDGWKLYPEQQEVVDGAMANLNGCRTTLLGLPPGGGKTVTMLFMAALLKSRFLLIVKPNYMERWMDAFQETYEMDKDQILSVSGSDGLKGLFTLANDEEKWKNIKCIIISNATFRNYLKEYEQLGDALLDTGYCVLPQDYVKHLKCKMVFIDEGHQDYHLNFRITTYTHAEMMVVATGTLISDIPIRKTIMNLQYPASSRFIREQAKGHLDSYGVFYRFKTPKLIKCETHQGYNHIEFENSIMKNKEILENYKAFLKKLIDMAYIYYLKPGYKCIIFVSTVQLATILTDYLKECYPDKDVRRYCEQDPYENLMEPDIRVTTIISSGTAVDVPGLSCNIMTQNLSSSASNIQVALRLRIMKDGFKPKYLWLVCSDIQKHLMFHDKRKRLLKPKMYNYTDLQMDDVL